MDQVWATDVICVLTAQGWLYLVAVLDVFSRRVIGWAMSQLLDTSLVSAALRMAINQRHYSQNLSSTRIAQPSSPASLTGNCSATRLTASISRKDNCYDNAFIESFFSSVEYALVYHRRFVTLAQAHTAIFDYIETIYNRTRLHSSLDYKTPINFESQLNQNHP